MTKMFVAFMIVTEAVVSKVRYVVIALPGSECDAVFDILKMLSEAHFAQETACETPTQKIAYDKMTAVSQRLVDAKDIQTSLFSEAAGLLS